MYFVHDVPGRLRVKIKYLKNNPHRLETLRQHLSVPGVYKVRTNALTGSIVIEYDPLTIDAKSLIDIFNANGHTVPEKNLVEDVQNKDHEKLARTLSRAIASWVAGQLLEANGLSYISAFI
ncbi:HMA2 domain-containing protein [Desulfobacter sp.]|jgi:hypothetical protein